MQIIPPSHRPVRSTVRAHFLRGNEDGLAIIVSAGPASRIYEDCLRYSQYVTSAIGETLATDYDIVSVPQWYWLSNYLEL